MKKLKANGQKILVAFFKYYENTYRLESIVKYVL